MFSQRYTYQNLKQNQPIQVNKLYNVKCTYISILKTQKKSRTKVLAVKNMITINFGDKC